MAAMADTGSCCPAELEKSEGTSPEDEDSELTSFMREVRERDRSSNWLFRLSASW